MLSIYLVQCGNILKPLKVDTKCRLSQVVNFDYMGSAEFEFGALPKSFRNLQSRRNNWNVLSVPEIIDSDSNVLTVFSGFSRKEFNESYLPALLTLRKPDRRSHTKESTHFSEDYKHFRDDYKTDFWWDIENHVMFSFDKLFMSNISTYVSNSLVYMDEAAKV